MKRTAAVLLAATAVVATLAVAVPGAASADTPQCSVQARAQVRDRVAPQIASYVTAHPDLGGELAMLRVLPKAERKAQWKSFRQSHPQDVQGYRTVRQPLIDYRKACHK